MTHSWVTGGADFLDGSYDENRALFSYSSRRDGRSFTNDWDHPAVIRYSINSLLGLQEAWRHGHEAKAVSSYPEKLDAFLSNHFERVHDWADRGLLLVLLSREGDSERAQRLLDQVKGFAANPSGVDLQSVSWMLWGSTTAARAGLPGADAAAKKLFRFLHHRYFNRDSLLASHSLNRYRKNLVSFGATAYYLRALYEYGLLFDDEYVLTTFDWAVRRVLTLQGPLGEWPWMIRVDTVRVVDPYPVFSVHQDSMAMLFLVPALERNIGDVEGAIARSCRWVEGQNELSVNMVTESPFFISRSIQRSEGATRLRRYLRSLRGGSSSWPAANASKVEVNPECRSYHIGWVLFVWSGRVDLLTGSLKTAR